MSNILITTGGTGGHIYPALSVADKLKEDGHNIVFVGSCHRMEKDFIPEKNYKFYGLDIIPIKNFKSLIKLFKAILETRKIIKKEKIDAVIGFGNYISLPSLISAKILGKKIYLQEQNIKLGLANKLFINFCDKIFLAFSETLKFLSERNKKRTIITGNPLRNDFYNITREEARLKLNLTNDDKLVLVMGGSLGAKNINEMLLSKLDSFKQEKIHLYWSTGKNLYEEMLLKVEDKTKITMLPYFENPSIVMAASDIILCRAGALTISELIELEKPSILIPYNGAGQLENAEILESVGASKVYNNDNVKEAIDEAIRLVKKEENLKFMSENIKMLKKENSIELISKIFRK